MYKRSITIFAVTFVFLGSVLAATYETAQLRNINKPSVYHKSGYVAALTPVILDNIGGVLSQAMIQEDGKISEIRLEVPEGETFPGYIIVHQSGQTARYLINYSELVRASLFVDGGRTSLYTLWDEERLPERFAIDAGFARTNSVGMVAIEFLNSVIPEDLQHLDLCKACLGDKRIDIQEQANEALGTASRLSDTIIHSSSYINTDLGAKFRLIFKQGVAQVEGEVFRFYWKKLTKDGPVVISYVEEINQQPANKKEAARLLRNVELNQAFAKLMYPESRSDVSDAYKPALQSAKDEVSGVGDKRISRSLELFKTLALLRTFRHSDKSGYDNYMKQLGKRSLYEAEPGSWDTYTDAVNTLYNEQ